MFGRQRRRVQLRQGRFVLKLDARERELIRQLLGELRELFALDAADPRVRRLYPAAYADDEDAENEYRPAHSRRAPARPAGLASTSSRPRSTPTSSTRSS